MIIPSVFEVEFAETYQTIDVEFEALQIASDGGFERGFEEGRTQGYTEGKTDIEQELLEGKW